MKKILIANRGEIANRIIKSCKVLGYKSVAVYSDADKNAKHVKMADEAFHIGPSKSQESYLNGDKILQVALDSKVDGIHPGFGFLCQVRPGILERSWIHQTIHEYRGADLLMWLLLLTLVLWRRDQQLLYRLMNDRLRIQVA